MNKRLSAIVLAVATSAFLAIGCGSTASYSETEEGLWDADITESEEIAEPGLEAQLLESDPGPLFDSDEEQPKKQP